MSHIRDRIAPANILLQIRNGQASDFKSLLESLAIPFDSSDSAAFIVAINLKRLVEAKIVEVGENAKLFDMVGSNPSISISRSWGDIQSALDISLSQIAALSRYETVAVKPLFGQPQEIQGHLDIFVLMPFQNDMKPVYEDHIKSVASALNLSVKRGDDFFTAESVMQDIWNAMNSARLIIADCTGRNPNVFYEIGVAHTIGKPVILVTQNADDVPFDLRHIRYIKYQLTPRGMKEFETNLRETILSITSDAD